jgi:hypothetical protein
VFGGIKLISRREALFHLSVIVAAPLLLALCNTEWLYSPAGTIDPWVSLGYALNYSDPTFWDDYYKISRLPWILLLYAAYHLLPPTAANHITHLGVFIATLIPFYLAMCRLVGGQGALIAGLLLSVYTHVHGSYGWDYHNAIAGAFYSWGYYFLTVGWQQSPKQDAKALFIAGVFIGLLLHTNVFFLLFAPLMLLHACSLRNGIRMSELLQTLILTSVGVTAVTVTLCLINWSVGRQFLFFKPIMVTLISFARDVSEQKPWWHPWSASWVGEALYLSFTIGILCASCVAIIIRVVGKVEKSETQKISYSIYMQFYLALTIWIVGQTAGHTFLDYSHFAYPLIFPAFAAFAAIAATNNIGAAKELPIFLILVFLLLVLVPLTFGSTFLDDMATRYFGFIKWGMIPSAFLFFFASILFIFSSRLTAITVAVGLLGLANLSLTAGGNRSVYLSAWSVSRYYGFSGRHCTIRKLVLDTAIQFSSKLRAASIPFSKVVLWYGSEEILKPIPNCDPITVQGYLGPPLQALMYDAVERSWNTMPEIATIAEDRFRAWATERKVLVILSQTNEAIGKMADRVRSLGVSARTGSAGVIDIGQAHLRIDLLSFQ